MNEKEKGSTEENNSTAAINANPSETILGNEISKERTEFITASNNTIPKVKQVKKSKTNDLLDDELNMSHLSQESLKEIETLMTDSVDKHKSYNKSGL